MNTLNTRTLYRVNSAGYQAVIGEATTVSEAWNQALENSDFDDGEFESIDEALKDLEFYCWQTEVTQQYDEETGEWLDVVEGF